MAVLYGRAGRLTAKTGGLRPRRAVDEASRRGFPTGALAICLVMSALYLAYLLKKVLDCKQVRKSPGWPRSWASFSLSQLYSHRMRGPACIVRAELTPLSLPAVQRDL
jgi:hypothetical protein